MTEKIIVYGAGKTGREAYWNLSSSHEILFFVDQNEKLYGSRIMGKRIGSPKEILNYPDVSVIVASIVFEKEITEYLTMLLGGTDRVFGYSAWHQGREERIQGLLSDLNENRSIDLGAFLLGEGRIEFSEMDMTPGGSMLLDYAFLYAVARKYHVKSYLEIGTYTGTSINFMADLCEKCYSLTAEPGSEISMAEWCRNADIPDYSDRLAYKDNIIHCYGNSQTFDYSKIKNPIDLYFIDGDHRFGGVYADTVNVFRHRSENSIVIWHDFKKAVPGQGYNDIVPAVYEAIGADEFRNVFCVDTNMCGIYLPEQYRNDFKLHSMRYRKGERERLYTFRISLEAGYQD